MHTISSYHGNRPTNKQTQPHTHRQLVRSVITDITYLHVPICVFVCSVNKSCMHALVDIAACNSVEIHVEVVVLADRNC